MTFGDNIEIQPPNLLGSSNDQIEIRLLRQREVFAPPFEISNGAIVDAGDCSRNRAQVAAFVGDQREWFAKLTSARGDFCDGKRGRLTTSLTWQPSKLFSLSTGIDDNAIDLPAATFTTRLLATRGRRLFDHLIVERACSIRQ